MRRLRFCQLITRNLVRLAIRANDDVLAFIDIMHDICCTTAAVQFLSRVAFSLFIGEGQQQAVALAVTKDQVGLPQIVPPKIACRNSNFSGYV